MEALLPLIIPCLVFFVVMMLFKQAVKAVVVLVVMAGITVFLEANGFSVIGQVRYFFDQVNLSALWHELQEIFNF